MGQKGQINVNKDSQRHTTKKGRPLGGPFASASAKIIYYSQDSEPYSD